MPFEGVRDPSTLIGLGVNQKVHIYMNGNPIEKFIINYLRVGAFALLLICVMNKSSLF
jgi:hypothetical protein